MCSSDLDLVVAGDGAAGVGGGGRDLLEGERRQIAVALAGGAGVAILPDHVIDGDFPHLGGALAQDLDRIAGGEDGGHRRREGAAAAVGHVIVAEGRGICDDDADLVVGDAEFLGGNEAEGGPVLAIRLQEHYGLSTHPTIAAGKVPLTLHLLSPAHRPIQITRDLPGFWKGSWSAVRSDMKGRYPRHLWPEDPASAAPTIGPRARWTRSMTRPASTPAPWPAAWAT